MSPDLKTLPSLIIFGSQAPEQSAQDLERLRTLLFLSPRLNRAVEALHGLSELYESLTQSCPGFQNPLSSAGLASIIPWLKGEKMPDDGVLSNTFVTTVTVAGHLALYASFLDTSGVQQAQILERCRLGGVQGFCTGLLAAVAISSSASEEAMSMHCAWAVRLAFCIGVVVDALNEASGGFKTAVVRGKSPEFQVLLKECIESHSGTYVSVLEDTTRATLTFPSATYPALSASLARHDIQSKQIPLLGRFHSPHNRAAFDALDKFCSSRDDLHGPTPLVPVLSNSDAQVLGKGNVCYQVLRCILVDPCNWFLTSTTALTALPTDPSVLMVGPNVTLPSASVRWSKLQVATMTASSIVSRGPAQPATLLPEHDQIAVIGIGLRFPKASTVAEFWDIISRGESVLGQVPLTRFDPSTISRPSRNSVPFHGAFLDDASSFDHKFFRKSSREAASTDPQQRILLEVAYHALQSAGYFRPGAGERDMGCFLGVGAQDYTDNLSCHEPGAFSALGTLRAFLAGKISHHFNLTGPSLTCDTACSSSAVAIDLACKAILSGDCTAALAGGVNIMTSPGLFENLNGSGFLSPTGQCKPFDAAADGYCRGEGACLVMLKRLDRAIADGDPVRGVIASSAVNQNTNDAPLPVPSRSSQAAVLKRAVEKAKVDVSTVSYVEAHGTGTVKGDPIEYSSIRDVFILGGSQPSNTRPRSQPLFLGSLKGNIGHLEGASGAASLIKVILMLENKTIPPQASHTKLSPRIEADPSIAVPTARHEWTVADGQRRKACINNYGASGNNAAMLIYEAPERSVQCTDAGLGHHGTYPVFVAAQSRSSLQAYCTALQATASRQAEAHLASFISRVTAEQNQEHCFAASAVVSSFSDLTTFLRRVQTTPTAIVERSAMKPPVVMVFGGQGSRDTTRVDKSFYDTFAVFRTHLDACDAIVKTLGVESGLVQACFEMRSATDDLVLYHTMLFAIQYASAKSWLDCGLKVDCVVGHSLGQLTALCVAGVVTLFDALKLVVGRARLVQDRWGEERGSMLAVETDESTLRGIISLSSADSRLEIACHNAPTSTVLAGPSDSISLAEETLNQKQIKTKRLAVSHAYHSAFTEGILDDLKNLASELSYSKPTIPVETCTSVQSWTGIGPEQIVEHTRLPVYFESAVGRIEKSLGPSCVWLEAGCQSSITGLVGRCLAFSSSHALLGVGMNKSSTAATDLAQTTTKLWTRGLPVQFWGSHRSERVPLTQFDLPPYQFDKYSHWLDWKDPQLLRPVTSPTKQPGAQAEEGLLTLSGGLNDGKTKTEFFINTDNNDYQLYVKGHSILDNPLCPASLYLELIAQAIHRVCGQAPCRWSDLEIKSPLAIPQDRVVMLAVSPRSPSRWEFEIVSRPSKDPSVGSVSIVHALGSAEITTPTSASQMARTLATFQSLIDIDRFTEMASAPQAQTLQGAIIYNVFSRVTNYGEYYRRLQSLVSCGDMAMGKVIVPEESGASQFSADTLTDPLAVDSFLQVAGLHVNCLGGECDPADVYVCTRVGSFDALSDSVCPSAKTTTGRSYLVCSTGWREDETKVVRDIFVFDTQTRKLRITIRGAEFFKVSIRSLTKMLQKASSSSTNSTSPEPRGLRAVPQSMNVMPSPLPLPIPSKTTQNTSTMVLKSILETLLEIPSKQITDGSSLEELGIDSIMSFDVATRISRDMGIEISSTELTQLSTFGDLNQTVMVKNARRPSTSDYSETSEESHTPSTDTEMSDLSVESGDHSSITGLLAEMLGLSDDHVSGEGTLASLGIDSLMVMELVVEIEKRFGRVIDSAELSSQMSVQELVCLVFPDARFNSPELSPTHSASPASFGTEERLCANKCEIRATWSSGATPREAFAAIRGDYASFCAETGFLGFYEKVLVAQNSLVVEYIIHAFEQLGDTSWSRLKPGDRFQVTGYLAKHQNVVLQLHRHLQAQSLLATDGEGGFIRTAKTIDREPAQLQLGTLLASHPQHRDEHQLLSVIGTQLAGVLSGATNPLHLLFQDPASRALLERVYAKAPMYEAMNEMLGTLIARMVAGNPNKTIRILEIGAGTGGTTRYVLKHLQRLQGAMPGVEYDYLFTDISSALVHSAKRTFASAGKGLRYAVLDLEKEPSPDLVGAFDLVISTNCVHATANLQSSCSSIRRLLDDGGCLLLIELTRNLPWLDVVFGMLDGWWLFNDGRKHALAHEHLWEETLLAAGFDSVDWTNGDREEDKLLRIVAGFCGGSDTTHDTAKIRSVVKRGERAPTPKVQTIEWKRGKEELSFLADVYTPRTREIPGKRPIALLVHGGGHCMLSRKDVRPRQVQTLIDYGFLPVSIDYRLCPEVDIRDGAMADVADALVWLRSSDAWDVHGPALGLGASGVVPDGTRVVVVGWSTGGMLALSAGWMATERGVKGPSGVLSFYCPTDYQDEFWTMPNMPQGSEELCKQPCDIIAGLQKIPILGHNLEQGAGVDGWRSANNARSRLLLHMNHAGQTLPMLLGGLERIRRAGASRGQVPILPQPDADVVATISPLCHASGVAQPVYDTPTFIIHGTEDDLVPWEQSQRFHEMLVAKGVKAGIRLVHRGQHLFDLGVGRDDGEAQKAVQDGYMFLLTTV